MECYLGMTAIGKNITTGRSYLKVYLRPKEIYVFVTVYEEPT